LQDCEASDEEEQHVKVKEEATDLREVKKEAKGGEEGGEGGGEGGEEGGEE
jgi:hypothetical protein